MAASGLSEVRGQLRCSSTGLRSRQTRSRQIHRPQAQDGSCSWSRVRGPCPGIQPPRRTRHLFTAVAAPAPGSTLDLRAAHNPPLGVHMTRILDLNVRDLASFTRLDQIELAGQTGILLTVQRHHPDLNGPTVSGKRNPLQPVSLDSPPADWPTRHRSINHEAHEWRRMFGEDLLAQQPSCDTWLDLRLVQRRAHHPEHRPRVLLRLQQARHSRVRVHVEFNRIRLHPRRIAEMSRPCARPGLPPPAHRVGGHPAYRGHRHPYQARTAASLLRATR